MSGSSSVTNLLLIVGPDPLYVQTISTEFPPQHHLIRFLHLFLLLSISINVVNVSLKSFIVCVVCSIVCAIVVSRHTEDEKSAKKEFFLDVGTEHRQASQNFGGQQMGRRSFTQRYWEQRASKVQQTYMLCQSRTRLAEEETKDSFTSSK